MSLDRELHRETEPPEKRKETDVLTASLIDMMMRDLNTDLDQLDGPSAGKLAALDELEEPSEDELAALDNLGPIQLPLDMSPGMPIPASALPPASEPEIVSLESLDDAAVDEELDEELQEEDEFLDELPDDYIDIDLEDDELDDEGYDLDDEDVNNYHDLYGADDSIIPSFREGESLDEDDGGNIAFYDDLR